MALTGEIVGFFNHDPLRGPYTRYPIRLSNLIFAFCQEASVCISNLTVFQILAPCTQTPNAPMSGAEARSAEASAPLAG